MFRDVWTQRMEFAKAQVKAVASEVRWIETRISEAVDHVLEARTPTVVMALEKKVRRLELDKAVMKERLAVGLPNDQLLDDTPRTSLAFSASHWNL